MPEDQLRIIAEGLRHDVQKLAPAMERHRVAVEKANRRSKIGVIVAIIGISVGSLGLFVGYNARETADEVEMINNARAAEQQEVRVASCIQFNAQRNEVRAAVKDALLALVPPGTPLSETQQETVRRYNAEVDNKLPYRDCSPAGITEYFKKPPTDPNAK